MHRRARKIEELREAWQGVRNFVLSDECVPFSFSFPPLERVVDEIRRDKDARILAGRKGEALDLTDIAEDFRVLPLEKAMQSAFQLSHFKLSNFTGRGQTLFGFETQVMLPWQEFLQSAGFTWSRMYPIIFISGRNCSTNYHFDVSHVIAWQVYGTKVFNGLKEPDVWAPPAEAVQEEYRKAATKPKNLAESDILAYEMRPGDVLWNSLLTPHWVDSGDEIACSVNISHGGLRLDGELCRNEALLEFWWADHPEERWKKPY